MRDYSESTDPNDFFAAANLPRFAWCNPAPQLDPVRWPELGPGFHAWLTTPVPILTIIGGTESERTHEAATLTRYWIDKATYFIPDNFNFYFADALSLVTAFKDRWREESDIMNVAQFTKFLVLTELHRVEAKDQLALEMVIRQRRNAGKFTVVTAAKGMPGVSETIKEMLNTGRVVKLA